MGEKLFTIQNKTVVNLPWQFQLIVYLLLGIALLLLSANLIITYLDYKEEVEETQTVTRLVKIIKKITRNS